MVKYQTHNNRIVCPDEESYGPVLVQKAGYISKNKRIKNMIEAGERLQQIRMDQYQYDGEYDGETVAAVDTRRLDPVDAESYIEKSTLVLSNIKNKKNKKVDEKEKVDDIVKKDEGGEESEEKED